MINRLTLAGALCAMPFVVAAGNVSEPIADTVIPAIAPTHTDDRWAGFYGGLSMNNTTSEAAQIQSSGARFVFGNVADETIAGAFLGYNVQRGNLIYGGELSYVDTTSTFLSPFGDRQDDVLSLRARAGYAVTDSLMAYGMIGLAKSSITTSSTETHATTYDQTGTVFGIGAQYLVTDAFFIGAEYSTTDVTADRPADELNSPIDTISLRLGYQF